MTRATAARRAGTVHRRLLQFGATESTVSPPWVERRTKVREIEAFLAGLWHDPPRGKTAVDDDRHRQAARAQVLNLIVSVPDEVAAARVVDTMIGLGLRHPSRAIVLAADPQAGGAPLSAAITAHCHPGHASGEPICYEVVVLTVRGEAAEHLSGIVAPLLIHDLPTHVWWPGDPPFEDPIFDQLVEMSDRVIVDSSDFGDLLRGMRRLATLRRRSGVGDLAWRRLGWWQELTAEFFDAPRFRRYLPNLNRLTIRYAVPERPPRGQSEGRRVGVDRPRPASPLAGPILYAGWIASTLSWRRYATREPLADGRLHLLLEGRYEMVNLLIEPVATDALPPGELISVRLRAFGEAGAAEFIIERSTDEAVVASNCDGMTALLRRVPMEQPTESELLAADLVSDRHDPVYESSLRAAAVLVSSARQVDAAG